LFAAVSIDAICTDEIVTEVLKSNFNQAKSCNPSEPTGFKQVFVAQFPSTAQASQPDQLTCWFAQLPYLLAAVEQI
jgi:hypothetical protein